MCSSSTPSSSILFTTDVPVLLRRRLKLPSLPSPSALKPRKLPRLSASADDTSVLDRSWLGPELHSDEDCYRGWFIVESPREHQRNKKGARTILIGGVGSFAVLFAALAYASVSRKGFKFQLGSPAHSLRWALGWNEADKSETKDVSVSVDKSSSSEASKDHIADTDETQPSGTLRKLERILVPVAADPTQQEAVSILKKLKIIEDDVRADELCTRREYARWLVHINSMLERNPKHRIIPSVALAGSMIAAFDDISREDPDFEPIQALAEAGIIPSTLSEEQSVNFHPESFISRQDLINWKAQLEYGFTSPSTDRISRTKLDYIDMKEVDPSVVPSLFLDMLAGEKSIIRRVFGQIKRFQPNKPSTKAQVAVALTCGRMSEAISAELSRIETEKSCRQAETEEICLELLDRGDIKRFWDEKLHQEHIRGLEIHEVYVSATHELERETKIQEKWLGEHLKEKAAVDCQKQLLLGLKEEVDEMSERLASEREIYMAEKCKTQDMLRDLHSKLDSLLDKKSILEAEIEAFRILRSWVEDEAKKSRNKGKVLEEARRRWKWEDQA